MAPADLPLPAQLCVGFRLVHVGAQVFIGERRPQSFQQPDPLGVVRFEMWRRGPAPVELGLTGKFGLASPSTAARSSRRSWMDQRPVPATTVPRRD